MILEKLQYFQQTCVCSDVSPKVRISKLRVCCSNLINVLLKLRNFRQSSLTFAIMSVYLHCAQVF